MIRSLWTASTGLNAQQVQIDIIANNLANVSTNGFKQARGIFADLLYQTLRQPGAQSSQTTQIPDGLQIGLGTIPVSTGRIFTQGSLQQTGNDLDVAINGEGFFQILTPDGTIAYTRDGAFQKDANGQVVLTHNQSPSTPYLRTQHFPPGETVRGLTEVELPADLAPGRYDVDVLVWDTAAQRNLSVVDSGGQPMGIAARLGQVEVAAATNK